MIHPLYLWVISWSQFAEDHDLFFEAFMTVGKVPTASILLRNQGYKSLYKYLHVREEARGTHLGVRGLVINYREATKSKI
jgi:hypothetical protein